MSSYYSHLHRHSHGETDHRHQHQHARKNWHRAIAREGGGEFSPQHQHDHRGDYGVTVAPRPKPLALSQTEMDTIAVFKSLEEDGYVDASEVAEALGINVGDVLRLSSNLPLGGIGFRRKKS